MWPEPIIIPASGVPGTVGPIGSTARDIPAVAMQARRRVGMSGCTTSGPAAVRMQ